MLRLGLCCTFRDVPIKFAHTTALIVGKLARPDQLNKLAAISLANAVALKEALRWCTANGVGCFRINSQILPLKTHPTLGYRVEELPGNDQIVAAFRECMKFAEANNLRMSFHPDQFVVLNSQRADVVEQSLREIEYQAEVAEWVGADVINVHGGGAFGNKVTALEQFARGVDRLSERARSRLTVENDDKIYSPTDLLPVCRAAGIPLVYDVHHHRCCKDGLSIEETTRLAVETWNREPLFHLSSPIEGWAGPKPERHHDVIDVDDFPKVWLKYDLTVEVEAKAKEVAVLALKWALESADQKAMRGPRTRAATGGLPKPRRGGRQ